MHGVLSIRLQTEGTAVGTAVGYVGDKSAVSPIPSSDAEYAAWIALVNTPGSGWIFQQRDVVEGGFVTTHAYFVHASGITDWSSELLQAKPEFFHVKTLAPITPDRWHHLLLSFDINIPITTRGPNINVIAGKQDWLNVSQGASSYARMWIAIDDVDYRGRTDDEGATRYHLGPYSVDFDISAGGPQGDPNGILTAAGFGVVRNGSAAITFGNQPMPVPTYNLAEPRIPSSTAGFGLPASAAYVESIYRVEMAELQMWTGIVLDTAILKNRRAFVDADGKPVNPIGAEELLGRKPEVMLHNSGKWKAGENTGTLDVNIDGDILPAGQFARTGGIEAYKPEPAIGA